MTAEPTETDRLAARAALKLGVLKLFDEGIGYISPTLIELSARDAEHAQKAARHTLDNWPMVSLAARRLLSASYHTRAA